MANGVIDKRRGILHGENGVSRTDTSVKRNPYLLAKREGVGIEAHHNNYDKGRTQQDIREEISQFRANSTQVMDFETSNFDRVIGYKGAIYGIIVGVNYARIDKINGDGEFINHVGNVTYDPQTETLGGNGTTQAVRNYIGDLLFNAPTTMPEIQIPKDKNIDPIDHIIGRINTIFSVDGTPPTHNK